MNRIISVAALLAAAVAICLIGYERAERRRAIREALAQREALMVQRYARLIGQMAEELGGGRGREDATIEEAVEDLRDAVRRLELTRYEERRELPPADGGADASEPAAVVEPVSDSGAAASRVERLELNPADPPKTVNTFVVASKPPTAPAPALAPSAGRIVMVERSDAGNRELVLLSAEGKDRRQLTWHVPKVDEAAMAAAADAAASDGARTGGEEAGEAAPPAAPEPVVYADNIDPCWRDDHTIVFASNRTGNAELWSLDLDTNETTRLTNTPGEESSPAASLDGRLAWTCWEQGKGQGIWIEGDDSSKEPTQLVKYGDLPSWSPDGARVAFAKAGSADLSVVPVDGSDERPLLLNGSVVKSEQLRRFLLPKWSPDGRSLLYTWVAARTDAAGQTASGINIVNVDDERKDVQVPADGGGRGIDFELGLGWSADGRKILFAAWRGDDHPELTTANADGGEPRVLAQISLGPVPVHWNIAAWEPAFLVKPPATASGDAAIASSRHKGNRPK